MTTDDTLHTLPDAPDQIVPDAMDADAAAPTSPPLYRTPVVLSSHTHAHWRLLPGDAAFAAASHAVPLVIGGALTTAEERQTAFHDMMQVALTIAE